MAVSHLFPLLLVVIVGPLVSVVVFSLGSILNKRTHEKLTEKLPSGLRISINFKGCFEICVVLLSVSCCFLFDF